MLSLQRQGDKEGSGPLTSDNLNGQVGRDVAQNGGGKGTYTKLCGRDAHAGALDYTSAENRS